MIDINDQVSTKNEAVALDVNSLPLNGVHLIEASAGTGKTYTITGIYVRLILGHECKALSPEQVLVVTFTRAATEELRDRIRKRLKQVLDAFEAGQGDDFCNMLIEKMPDAQKAKQRLRDALQLMDLAAIYTIHSFAQKLLRQHTVEAQVAAKFELVLDESEILLQAVQDVWRSQVYPLSSSKLSLVLSQWSGPEALMSDVRNMLYKDVEFHLGDNKQDFDEADEKYQVAFQNFEKKWSAHGQSFINDITNHPEVNGTFKKGISKKQQNIQQFIAGLKVKNDELNKALESFTRQGLIKSVKKSGEPVDHILSDHCQNLLDYKQVLDSAKSYALRQWRVSFIQLVQDRLAYLKQKKQLLSTDDLLQQLNTSLYKHDDQVLAQPIRDLFPVAMVDEFQDTDAAQYQVFRKLYVEPLVKQDEQPQSDYGLFMIGDPKQAIYKFRGADIFTYIQAKQEAQYSHSLHTNYRSTKTMVNAVNKVFSQHNQSFIFDDSIPFVPVDANDKAHYLLLNDKPSSALSWMYVNTGNKEIKNKSMLTEFMAQGCAEEIVCLLNASMEEQVCLQSEKQSNKLKAKDLAVLVRNRNQARAMKDALTQRGVGCVYVGQDSIFDSQEAQALLMLLLAVHGLNEKQYRNAISHPIWMLSLEELHHYVADETSWEAELEMLYACHELWLKQGIMGMIMHFIHERALPQKWLNQHNGERCITNFLHIAELLQQSTAEHQGMQGLLSWYEKQVTQSLLTSNDGEQKQLRLESDANLVQIVTIHKSKGLEYPVVFLPFAWDGKESKDEIFYDESTQSLRGDLADDFKPQRIKEGLAEEIRLLYVALTRASTKCYVGIPNFSDQSVLKKTFASSALKYVLFAQDEPDVFEALTELSGNNISDTFDVCGIQETCSSLSETVVKQKLCAEQFSGNIRSDWMLTSFSSLVRHHHAPHTSRFNMDDDLSDNTTAGTFPETPTQVSESSESLTQEIIEGPFVFPRGAHAGNFLHTLLEEIDFTHLPNDLDSLITDLMTRFGIEITWLEVVKDWLDVMLITPLQHDGLALGQLNNDLKLVEMEFYFPIESLSSEDFNQLVNTSPVLSYPVNDVDFKHIKGMMKGFIDLTFCWQGQYFIIDYKSNHLGDSVDCYQNKHMQQAMADHRYDVQLILYTLALHRLLKLRLSDYDYDTHIGGGYYLFLRGLNTEGKEGQFFHKPAKSLIENLDALIDGKNITTSSDLQEVL